jgi:hypothetical protein
MNTQPQLLSAVLTPADVVWTPDWAAYDMVRWFNPKGKVLDPCRGDDAIFRYLKQGADWCEINKGRDFFQWTGYVDWIIGNPPFNKTDFPRWMQHSFEIALNVVYIMPVRKFFSSNRVMEMAREFGSLRHIRIYGPGGLLGWNFGHPCGALYWSKDGGDTSWSFYGDKS